MQIVIKIDENLYTRLFDNGDIDAADMRRACVAIRKGTPLPKGLIAADKVQEKINKLLKEPDYQHEGEDWKTGLIMAEELIVDASHKAEIEAEK